MKRTKKLIALLLAGTMAIGLLAGCKKEDDSSNDKPTVTSAQIDGTLHKTEYKAGESLDPAGLTMTLTYDNGEQEKVELTAENTTVAPETLDSSVKEVSITCNGNTVKYTLPEDVTIKTEDKGGNGESKYLTQADFDEINDYLEQKAERGKYSVLGENDSVKESLKNGQQVSGYVDCGQYTYSQKEYVQSKDGIKKLIEKICAPEGPLTNAIGDADGRTVEVYVNITDDAVTVWFVAINS